VSTRPLNGHRDIRGKICVIHLANSWSNAGHDKTLCKSWTHFMPAGWSAWL